MSEERAPVQRIVRGAVQNLGSVHFARLVNWVANILLMRWWLSEEHFGYLALTIPLLTITVALFRGFGLHVALLHQYDRVDRLVPTHFLLNVGLGALSTLAAIGLGLTFVPGWYGGTVTLALVIFAVFDFFRNALLTSETELRRDLQFGRLAGSHATALIAASLVAVAAAYAGGGVWALILGFSVNSISYVAVYCTLIWVCRPPPLTRLRDFDLEGARGLFNFGFWIWVGVVMQTLAFHYDKLVVGSFLSARMVGFYERAYTFAQMPTGAITHTIASVTGTVYARYQNDRMRLSSAFRRTLRLIIRATVPITLVFAVEAPDLVKILVGKPWLPLVPILRWLVPYALCRPVLDDIRSLLFGVGKPKTIARYASVQAGLLLILAPLLTWRYGTTGTAVSMDVIAFIGAALAIRAAAKYVDIPWRRAIVPPLLAGGAALAVRLAFADFIGGLSTLASLTAGAGVICTVYGIVLLVLERRELLEELQRLWSAFAGRPEP